MELNDRSPTKGPGQGQGQGQLQGDGRRRRRRRRGRGGGPGGGPGGGGGGGGGGQQSARSFPQANMPYDPDDCRTKPAAAAVDGEPGMEVLDPFSLFCAYHLGITRDNGYRFQSVQEVARRFGVDVNTIKQRLADYDLETDALRRVGFDTQLAQLDMQVAPEGVSRRELAKTLWQEVIDQRGPIVIREHAPVLDEDEGEDLDEGDDDEDEAAA